MAIGSLVTAVHTAADNLAAALEDLHVDPAKIEDVVTALKDAATELSDQSFTTLGQIGVTSFGGTQTAQTLGVHHDRAYRVMDETLTGVVEDLEAFSTNVTAALKLVEETDTQAAADLDKKREIADALTYVWTHSHGDSAHDEARNDQHDGEVTS